MSIPISEASPVRFAGVLPPRADVVVIGGGVIGVMTAWFLRERGLSVVVCEKGRIAGEQSGRNWGWVRQQGRDPGELPIMVESLAIWKRLAAEMGDGLGFRQTGVLYLAKTEAEIEGFEAWTEHSRAHQLDTIRVRHGAPFADSFAAFAPQASGLAHELRLPLLNLALPALRALPSAEVVGAVATELLRRDDRPDAIISAPDGAALGVLAAAIVWSLWQLRRHMQRRQAAEQALSGEHAFRKAMEDSLKTGMRARDLNGRITYVNPAFCRMVGWSAEELVGMRPPMPYWAPEAIEHTRGVHQQILGGKAPPQGLEVRLMRRNGERFDALVIEAPLIDDRGRHIGWMGSVVDVTEQKRAQELARQQQERLQAQQHCQCMESCLQPVCCRCS